MNKEFYQKSLRCAILCSDVYYNTKNIRNTGMATWEYEESTNTICFRGSDDKRDWLFNTAIDPVVYWNNTIGLHGFYDIFLGAELELRKLINKLPMEMLREITITGHSLGGALAQVCASYLHNYYGVVVNTITFGSPYVFKQSKEVEIALRLHQRFVNGYDAVCWAPPSLLCGYQHFGTTYWLEKPIVYFVPKFRGLFSLRGAHIDDHFIDRYQKALNKLA